ncbi:hypothetical protein [Mycolicibacterium septicum]|uniref:hypothetical protein n=1 Tax=Mycolicibacterium septicum TaxID=98668 RepID=UPI0023611806|nr:hypothetical protein [Mycolicibacterium septicum]
MTTASPLVRAALRVVVLDKARFPSDTLSTHPSVPGGVQQLLKWVRWTGYPHWVRRSFAT